MINHTSVCDGFRDLYFGQRSSWSILCRLFLVCGRNCSLWSWYRRPFCTYHLLDLSDSLGYLSKFGNKFKYPVERKELCLVCGTRNVMCLISELLRQSARLSAYHSLL
ncbi:hypothetical protein BpHYR1_036309 [Brachionus plicatilis]|uniref:Uncharacterized protein n=1 Tax=Brachionus plicatilis TaxID=10195 RepID=A0A3M7SLD3_BRAPC|nr:hypothetical protein BpHYR1_036309 [Brachionus plicatilis]